MKRIVFILVVSVCFVSLATGQELQAGAAKKSIVPPFPTKMGGYFDRVASFEGVDTPIHARALMVSNDETTVGVVAVDLVAISRWVVDEARTIIQDETGVPGENIMISATHNHSGPSGFKGASLFGQEESQELTDFLVKQISDAAMDAYKAMEPAEIGFAYGRLDSITHNRQQNNDTVIDPDVGVLRVQKADSREVIGVLANFTGHPVILGGNNLLISCEYPGRAAELVEETLGGVCVYTQGAAGDVTMKRSGDPFEEIQRLGNIVGAEIIKTAEHITPGDDTELFAESQDVTLEPRDVPSPAKAQALQDEAREKLEQAKADERPDYVLDKLKTDVNAAGTTAAVAQAVAANPEILEVSTNTTVQVMQIGPLVAVAIPGEIFVEYGLEMKDRIDQNLDRPMVLVGYANDYVGYIVTPRAATTGGYEQAIARVAPSAGRTMTEAAMDIVRENIEPR